MAQQSSSTKHQSNGTPKCFKTALLTEQSSRTCELAGLLPLWAEELNDTSYAGRLRVLAKLRRALRSERQHGTSGHWSYDLARHKALLEAYRREANLMRAQSRACKPAPLVGLEKDK